MTLTPNGDSALDSARLLTALLRQFAWTPTGGFAYRYEVWEPTDASDSPPQIIVPLNPQAGDFAVLIERARSQLFAEYGREARRLARLVEMRIRSSLELTEWRKETSLTSGVIDWEGGEQLYTSAKAQLMASAKATRQPRRYHGNASPYIAKRFLDSSFMGQTGAGSFIISAYTPSISRIFVSRRSEEVHEMQPREVESFTGREIMDTFIRSLSAVRQSLEDYRKRSQIEIFLEATSEGVSYELTKALSVMAAGGDSSVQITRHGTHETTPRVEFNFESPDASILERASTAFAQDPESVDVTVIGEVTLLSRARDAVDRVIRLKIEDGAEIRKARVRLSAEQYAVAMEAHASDSFIRVTGSLEKEGHLYWIYNPTNLEVVPADHYDSPDDQQWPNEQLF